MMPHRVDIYVPSAQQASANGIMNTVTGETGQGNNFVLSITLGGSVYYWCSIVFNDAQYHRFQREILKVVGAIWYMGDSRLQQTQRILIDSNSNTAQGSIGTQWSIDTGKSNIPSAQPLKDLDFNYLAGSSSIDFASLNSVTYRGDREVIEDAVFYSSDTNRVSAESGSNPTDITGAHFHIRGSSTFRRCVFHDLKSFGVWEDAQAILFEDCLIYNIGWTGADRTHGHTLYTQNNSTTHRKVFRRCVFAMPYAEVAQIYGSANAHLIGFSFINCVFLSNKLSGSSRVLIGSNATATRANDIVIDACHSIGTSFNLGYQDTANIYMTVTNCHIHAPVFQFNVWDAITIQNNLIYTGDVIKAEISDTLPNANHNVDDNAYHGNMFTIERNLNPVVDGTFSQWQALYDTNSTYSANAPADSVHVHAGVRSWLIVIHNYSLAETVSIMIDNLSNGTYTLHNAQDYFGDTRAVIYAGGNIVINMSASTVATPAGDSAKHETTLPQHGVFILKASS